MPPDPLLTRAREHLSKAHLAIRAAHQEIKDPAAECMLDALTSFGVVLSALVEHAEDTDRAITEVGRYP